MSFRGLPRKPWESVLPVPPGARRRRLSRKIGSDSKAFKSRVYKALALPSVTSREKGRTGEYSAIFLVRGKWSGMSLF